MIEVKATLSMTAIPELGSRDVPRGKILEVDESNPRVQALIRAGYLSEIPGVSDDALGVTGGLRVSLPRLVAGIQRPQEEPAKKRRTKKEVTDGDSGDLPAGGERLQPVGDSSPRPQDG
jgi:hypothetical protein